MPDNSKSLNQPQLSTKNYILNSFPKEDFERLLPDFEQIRLALCQVLYRPEEPIEYIYFPDNSMVSVIANTVQGQCAEAGVI